MSNVKKLETINQSITYEQAKKAVKSMNLINNFLFNYVMEDDERAKEVAQIIISTVVGHDVKVDNVKSQKVFVGNDTDNHGIRLDAYVDCIDESSDSFSSVYDIEMEDREADREGLPRRHRYYSSLVESKLLKSGRFYETLPDYISITILSYDPFLAGDMYYEAKTTLVSHDDIKYDDGRKYIFLYGGGKCNIPGDVSHSKKLSEMIKYIVTGKLEDNPGKNTQRLNEIINSVKDGSEVTKNYMKEWEIQRLHDKELTEQVTQQVTQKVTQKVTESINNLNVKLISLGRSEDIEKAAKDPVYQKKLMEELFSEKKDQQ